MDKTTKVCPVCNGSGRTNHGTPDEKICTRCGGSGIVRK